MSSEDNQAGGAFAECGSLQFMVRHTGRKSLRVVSTQTCKHGDLVNVVKLAKSFTVEASPQIRHENLCSFVKANPAPIEDSFVTETCKMLGEQIDQASSRVVGAIDEVGKTASKLLVVSFSITKFQRGEREGQHTLHRMTPASRKHCTRSLNKGISSSVADRKTYFNKSSVHSISSSQKSGVVIGMSEYHERRSQS